MPQRLLSHARRMRHQPTDAEASVWRYLRAHRFAGFKFKRQQPIGPYIVDFVCFQQRLIVEIDGSQHQQNAEYDERRSRWLRSQGFTVLRFWNHDVLARADAVMEAILLALPER